MYYSADDSCHAASVLSSEVLHACATMLIQSALHGICSHLILSLGRVCSNHPQEWHVNITSLTGPLPVSRTSMTCFVVCDSPDLAPTYDKIALTSNMLSRIIHMNSLNSSLPFSFRSYLQQ